MRRLFIVLLLAVPVLGASLLIRGIRAEVKALVRPEPPAQITPLALTLPATATTGVAPTTTATHTASATATVAPASATPTHTSRSERRAPTSKPAPTSTPAPSATIAPTATPAPTATATPIMINGRLYDAYIPAASKAQQAYQYSCEFDAAWVILQTFGFDVSVDELIGIVGLDDRVEPYIEETSQGFIIHGGDVTQSFSGDYKKNFLARSSGAAMRKAFEHFGLGVTPVGDRAGIEAALRRGELIWMKTTVDFKPWRPAIWRMPDGRTLRTVLGNDHAVVVIGFNAQSVVIRDVLGPTSSNRSRPYEYEVAWDKFLTSWEAQSFDGLAVAPPRPTQ
jgi:hypothetical protein